MEDLIGTPVLVHPKLTMDPAQRQGHVGVIPDADLDNDTVQVSFSDYGSGLYTADALLVLKPHNEMYRDLRESPKKIKTKDHKMLLRVLLMLQYGQPHQQLDALAMVRGNEKTLNIATVSLQDRLELLLGQDREQEHRKGLGR